MANPVIVNQENGTTLLRRCVRLFSRGVYRHGEAIERAAGLHKGRIGLYTSFAALANGNTHQPLHEMCKLADALVEVRGEEGRLAFADWLSFLSSRIGYAVVPIPQRDPKPLAQEIAEADQATARLRIEQTRRYLDADGPTAHDVEQCEGLASAAVLEIVEAQAAAAREAVGR